MQILRIVLKIALFPVIVMLLIAKVIVKIGMQISSVILGGLILFVAGCLIYTIIKQTWDQTFLLVLIEGGIRRGAGYGKEAAGLYHRESVHLHEGNLERPRKNVRRRRGFYNEH